MKLSSFITLVTTIAVAGSASIVRNPVTFVKAFNCKKTKAPKAPKAPKSRATTPDKKGRGFRGKRRSPAQPSKSKATPQEAPVRERRGALGNFKQLADRIFLGSAKLATSLPAITAGVFTAVIGIQPDILDTTSAFQDVLGLPHCLIGHDQMWSAGLGPNSVDLETLIFDFFELVARAQATDGKVLLALPSQFAAVLVAAYLMRVECMDLTEAMSTLQSLTGVSGPPVPCQIFGYYARQFLEWTEEVQNPPLRLLVFEKHATEPVPRVYRHEGHIDADAEDAKGKAYLLHNLTQGSQILAVGQGATIAAQELARDFCRSWAKFGDMGEAEVWDEPSAVSKLLKCYEVMRMP